MPVFDSDEPTARRRAVLGMGEALSRCAHFMEAGDVDRMYLGYVETVMWIRSLDELFQRRDPDYVSRRNDQPGGQVVNALCWVRDKGIHQIVAFHEKVERSENDLGLGPSYPDGTYAVWLKSSEVVLRVQNDFGNDVEKARIYDLHLGGRSLWATLAEARLFLFMDEGR
jgi:hypothetical protein